MPRFSSTPGAVGSDVVLLLNALQYEAEVIEVKGDTVTVRAIAINNQHEFTRNDVKRAPSDLSKIDPIVPYWTTREELDAVEKAKAAATKA